jgi:preprotein translocase subunit SecG
VAILTGILNTLLVLISLFLICLVLIQRGKGGGLAGAFGGVGGSSAFGTKAGDVFTRVTIVVAVIWISLSMLLVMLSNRGTESAWGSDSESTATRQVPAPSSSSTVPAPPPSAPTGRIPSAPAQPSSGPSRSSKSSPSPPVSVPAIPEKK